MDKIAIAIQVVFYLQWRLVLSDPLQVNLVISRPILNYGKQNTYRKSVPAEKFAEPPLCFGGVGVSHKLAVMCSHLLCFHVVPCIILL